MTLAEQLELSGGRPNGFNYMRLILALAVVSFHTNDVTYGAIFTVKHLWTNKFYYSVGVWIVPSFFVLSGFLVAGSLERCNTIAGFLFLRIIRIFPALIVEITLSALVLGPLMTQLPLTAYFHDPQFRLYFLNCVGDIHYILPGVFIHNPFPQYVNSQLWTVPLELQCYAILAVLGLLGIAHRRALFLPVALAVFGAIVFYYLRHNDHNPTEAMRGHNLIPCFLFGVLAYNFRSILPYNRVIAILAFVAAVWLLLLPSGRFLAPLPIAYVVVFLGCANPRIIGILETGDYSYGIYLYGFPIQQAVVATGWFPANRWIHLAVALPLVVLLAVCSWHLWEKHWLKLKRFRPNLDGWFSVTKPGKLVGQIYRLALAEKI